MTSMLSQARSRRATRTAIAVGAVTLGLVALSACQKPTPVATLTAGSDSAHTEAACYKGGERLGKKDFASCVEKFRADEVREIKVSEGDNIGFGVEPAISENGWQVFVNGQPALGTFKSTYRTFEADYIFSIAARAAQSQALPKSANVSIVEAKESTTSDDEYYGVWHFKVEKK
ncbi:DUF2771 domain-containing protein [Streptomyces gobiensis]|uniref:DUF2771 domain-containing protein n=1 Tax=Streptomyces gobiensis TaxID=2875706 RepID=UPI001E572AF7|nr:DUF2771 domain-containing protein [Streptomyces gobiensis]UGY92073.1 DUF2771 domain-containing protein [Streptomyces gobiensis]